MNNKQKKGSKKVGIIIVNWNGKSYLDDCLKSIRNQTYTNISTILVDNGSTDGSVEFVKKYYKEVVIIKLEENKGFAKGNNIGIKKAFEDINIEYIFTLNNDTTIEPNTIGSLISIANQDKKIGSVAPKMIFLRNKKVIDNLGISINKDGGAVNRGSKEVDQGQYDKSSNIFGVCAGAALYKREAIESIRLNKEYFDDDFFAYYEDLDLAWRLRLAGWRSMSCPEAIVYHVHSATAVSHSLFKSFYMNRNRFYVMLKNYPFGYLVKAVILTPIRYLMLANSMRIKKGPSHELKKNVGISKTIGVTLKAWGSAVWHTPRMIKKRRAIQRNKKVSNKVIGNWFIKYSKSMKEGIY